VSQHELRKLLQQRVQAILNAQAVVVEIVDHGVETLDGGRAGSTEREARASVV
jgi:hypothetical protein